MIVTPDDDGQWHAEDESGVTSDFGERLPGNMQVRNRIVARFTDRQRLESQFDVGMEKAVAMQLLWSNAFRFYRFKPIRGWLAYRHGKMVFAHELRRTGRAYGALAKAVEAIR